MVLVGHCNCEAIRITVDDSDFTADQPPTTIYCHCWQCRRQSGGNGTYVTILDDDKVKIEGELKDFVDNKTDSGTPLHRYFCGTCGCPAISKSDAIPGKTVVKMGLFETCPKPTIEFYCKNKLSWEPDVEGAHKLQTNS